MNMLCEYFGINILVYKLFVSIGIFTFLIHVSYESMKICEGRILGWIFWFVALWGLIILFPLQLASTFQILMLPAILP
jgi:hypothetical protein